MLINNYTCTEDASQPDLAVTEDALKKIPEASKRVIARKGGHFVVFKFDDIAYFYVENGVSYLVDRGSNCKYITAKPLRDIEINLHSKDFFRATKKYLISINAVVRFKSTQKGKLEVILNPPPNEAIIVSQLKARVFREWILH